ncbi:hypothetical protein A9Q91_03730 [Candidatus Gracilibacteria bacterium 28_42_T64]|nr:hypothetical protein A9Q91_03730 [Candidatus Gracilibacteria bacterium 28_42_T64]
MKPFQSIVLILVSIIFFFFGVLGVSASSSFSGIESNISAESNIVKITKLQIFFKSLDLYNGNIDGKYSSIEKSLIDYQMTAGIVKYSDDWGAGFFGKKTLTALEKEFGDRFKDNLNTLKVDEPESNERYFYVTAYYSPLPGQKRYTTGTYAGDKRLNGNGKITASGKPVFVGLFAAPRNYKYGTKIELEGIGIGSVEDRGGAIVNAGERGFEHDRIDIWMGYGDEGLRRALKWGKRKVKGRIVEDEQLPTVGFDESPVTKYNKLRVNAESKKDDIKKLQSLFTEIKLYNKDIDGDYNSIKDELIDFQIKNHIIESRISEEAGYFGVKTLDTLHTQFGSGIFAEVEYLKDYTKLTRREILKLKKVKYKILSYIDTLSGGNNLKKYKIKSSFRKKLEKVIDKSGSKKKKQQLKFLKLIL